MSGAHISDGDYVVVDRSLEARLGHIIVALVHGDRAMKRLRRRAVHLWLVPEVEAGEGHPKTLVDQDVEVWARWWASPAGWCRGMAPSSVILIDGDNYYVGCERAFKTSLIGVPAVVASNNDGCAIARLRTY